MERISIVTGGASGLGLELTRELVSKNQNVCIIGRDAKKIENAIAQVGGTVVGYSGDICDELFVKNVFSDLAKKGYYVDAQKMINTACNMDPSNSEYRAARDRLNMQARGYGGGYQTSQAKGCSGCDVCSSLLCADCCCECLGGDLIRCC